MFGLFVEHGPYVVYKNMTGSNSSIFKCGVVLNPVESSPEFLVSRVFAVGLRDFAWTKQYSVLYIDNPVSVFFSTNKHDITVCVSVNCIVYLIT